MKISFLLLFLLPFSLYAQQTDILVKSEVKEVILYQSAVQEIRQAKLDLPAGNHQLKFSQLPNAVNPASIQVKGVSSFTILSINYQQNYLTEESEYPELQALKDTIDYLKTQVDFQTKMIFVLNEEKNMLRANKKLVNNNGLSVDDLKEISEFSSDRIHAIDVRIINMNKELQKMNDKLSILNQQYTLETTENNRATGEILVNVSSKSKITGILQLSYITGNAGWTPFYDIRANEVGGPVSVSYKANVHQLCGTNWENVKLTLSTAQPNISNSKPIVPIWFVNFYTPQYRGYAATGSGALSNTLDYNVEKTKSEKEVYTYSWNGPVNAVAQNAVNTEFQIKTPYSIPSDGVNYVVEIGTYDFEASYNYSAVPKLAKEAFLIAGITGWYSNSFLPAPSNIYYKGTFVGKSFLNTNTSKDTLDISMGSDESVVIKRKNISAVDSKTATGSSKKIEEKFEISIRNTKSVAIDIEIEDHIPVSKQKEISVDVTEISGEEHNKDSGRLKWKLKLEPNSTKTIVFGYIVKYPKNYVIDNL